MDLKRLRGLHWFSLRVDEIGEGGIERAIELEDEWLRPLLTPQFHASRGGAEVEFRAHRVGDNVDARGSVRTRVSFECSRCGDDAALPIATDFEVLFVPAGARKIDLVGDGDAAELEGDFAVEEISAGAVDVEPAVAEALVLSMPAYPLCGEDCRGRCGACGANLNQEACRCAPEGTVDPRWAALTGLRQQLADGDAGKDPRSRKR